MAKKTMTKNVTRARDMGLAPGYWVALVLVEGAAPLRCYVGQVQAIDERGVRLTLVDWVVGIPAGWDFFAPWPSILSALVATPQHDVKRFGERAAKWQEQMDARGGPDSIRVVLKGQEEEARPTLEVGKDSKAVYFDVILVSAGDKKIQVIQAVRELTGCGLQEAKNLVDGPPPPQVIWNPKVTTSQAAEIAKRLRAAGATVEVRPRSPSEAPKS